jgi:hypothetical protein
MGACFSFIVCPVAVGLSAAINTERSASLDGTFVTTCLVHAAPVIVAPRLGRTTPARVELDQRQGQVVPTGCQVT